MSGETFADTLFDSGEGLFEVNPSLLQCYLDCPRQYRFRYVDRRQERRAFPHTSVGLSVHKTLRKFYGLVAEERTLENMLVLLRRCWEGAGFASRKDEQDARHRAEDMLRTYFDSVDHSAVRPLALESKFAFAHPGAGIIVAGRVDRLDSSGDEYVIVDYKTGSYRQDRETLDSSLPLSVYAMAVSGRLGRDVTRIVLHHLASGERSETHRDRERLRGDWARLTDLVGRMRSDTEFTARPGALCHWCDYLSVCPEGQAEENHRRVGPGAPPEPVVEG